MGDSITQSLLAAGIAAGASLAPAQYSLAQEFNIDVPKEAMITGMAAGHVAAPPINQGYVFMRPRLRDLLAFWQSDLKALKVRGDPATGKSSIIEQFHARLRWPLYMVSCAPSTEAYHLVGQLMPAKDGTLQWVDGPVLKAARYGHSVLLDEFNVLDPGQATGLNLLLEGYAITIPETGEVVRPMPGFKVFATENRIDSRLTVAGRNVQDVANDDRWMEMEVDYLPEDVEVKAVFQAITATGTPPDQAEMLAKLVVKVANQVRTAYRNGDTAIEKPMSTRVAIRWAMLVRRFQNVQKDEGGPVAYALRRAFSGMSPTMATAVESFTRAVL